MGWVHPGEGRAVTYTHHQPPPTHRQGEPICFQGEGGGLQGWIIYIHLVQHTVDIYICELARNKIVFTTSFPQSHHTFHQSIPSQHVYNILILTFQILIESLRTNKYFRLSYDSLRHVLQSYLIPYCLQFHNSITLVLLFISHFTQRFFFLSFNHFIVHMLLRFNMFLPPTFLQNSQSISILLCLSFCFDLFFSFFVVALIPLFHFLRIVCPILPFSF